MIIIFYTIYYNKFLHSYHPKAFTQPTMINDKESAKEFILCYYNSVREEVFLRVKARDLIIYYYYLGSIAIFGFVFTQPNFFFIINFVPVLALIVASNYIQHDLSIRSLADYCRDDLKSNLIKAGLSELTCLKHWDSSDNNKSNFRIRSSEIRYITILYSIYTLNIISFIFYSIFIFNTPIICCTCLNLILCIFVFIIYILLTCLCHQLLQEANKSRKEVKY